VDSCVKRAWCGKNGLSCAGPADTTWDASNCAITQLHTTQLPWNSSTNFVSFDQGKEGQEENEEVETIG
jgi:hypothetical protein